MTNGNATTVNSALVTGGLVLARAIAFYGRGVAYHGREPELKALPTP